MIKEFFNKYFWITVISAGIVFSLLSVSLQGSGQPDKSLDLESQQDVIIISVNLLRSDHMPCYGYERNTTPNICSVADEGVKFNQAVSPATWSLPAYGSLFTAHNPKSHGLRKDDDSIRQDYITLAEYMKKKNYRTGGFVGSIRNESGQLRPKNGFERGFDTYKAKGHLFNDTIPPAREWLIRNKNESTFLFLHGQELHYPWEYPEGYEETYVEGYSGELSKSKYTLHTDFENDSRILDQIHRINGSNYLRYNSSYIALENGSIEYLNARYDGGARYTDYKIGKFLDWLKDNEMYENSTVIITSDHGTNIGDRTLNDKMLVGHGGMPYEDQIRIPLIIKPSSNLPKPTRESTSSIVGLIDIMPTIVDITGGEISDSLAGRSLKSMIWGSGQWPDKRYMLAETARSEVPAIRSDEWKLIDAKNFRKGYLLYNLELDKVEKSNVVDDHPNISQLFKSKLEEKRIQNLN